MPIFDYECGYCESIYEIIKTKSDQVPVCPHCAATDHQTKQFSAPAIAYATQDDYPKTNRELSAYLGNGQYIKGYKRGM